MNNIDELQCFNFLNNSLFKLESIKTDIIELKGDINIKEQRLQKAYKKIWELLSLLEVSKEEKYKNKIKEVKDWLHNS